MPHSPQPNRSGQSPWRQVQALAAAVMLALQLVFPGLGQADNSGTWVEICSDLGSLEVEINSGETRTPSADCPDCEICLLCATDNDPARPQSLSLTYRPVPHDTAPPLGQGVILLNPAQFWHDGRGPPRPLNAFTKHTTTASAATTLTKGGAPWT